MLTNSFLKLQSNNPSTGIFHSDNLSSYFYLTDLKDEFNGLWSNGFHLLKAIYPKTSGGTIVSKSVTPIDIRIASVQNITASFILLDNGKGLIADFSRPKQGLSRTKNSIIVIDIDRPFEIVSKSNDRIILRYSDPDREGFEIDNIYMSVSCTQNDSFDNVTIKPDGIEIAVRTAYTITDNRDQIEMILNYSSSTDTMTQDADYLVKNISKLKKNHSKNTFLPIKYVNTNVENSYFNKGLTWAMLSSSDFVMQKVGNIGIWAGFHWFDNNWGRDTFISLPGISLVSGRYEEARHIIETFSRRICTDKSSPSYGKVPNVIFNEDNVIYNTSDAAPLLIREIYEYYLYSGDAAAMIGIIRNIMLTIDNAYIARKDDDGLISQPDSDDWMDAKLDGKYPLSPRGSKAVEIQALWYTALHAAAVIIGNLTSICNVFNDKDTADLKAKAASYIALADTMRDSIRHKFCTDDAPYIYDHINEDGTGDTQIRPNGLLAVHYSTMNNIPALFEDEPVIRYLKYIHPKLIYLHGVCSLDKYDAHFHGRHIDEMYHKDAAYHNGCNWLWLSGAYINVMCRYGLQDTAFRHTQSLTDQLMNLGTLGTLSELNDPYTPNGQIIPSGTYSQAWSVAEYCRAFYQDYLGIRPDLPSRMLFITPSLPNHLGAVKHTFRYGYSESLSVYIRINRETGRVSYLDIRGIEIHSPMRIICRICLSAKGTSRHMLVCEVKLSGRGDYMRMNFDKTKTGGAKLSEITVSGSCEIMRITTEDIIYKEEIRSESIEFAGTITDAELNALKTRQTKDYYEKIARKNKPTTVT